jgi:hypothetical protein
VRNYVELGLGLLKAPLVQRVDQKHYPVNFGKVVLPKLPGCGNNRQNIVRRERDGAATVTAQQVALTSFVPPEVKSFEPNLAHDELVLVCNSSARPGSVRLRWKLSSAQRRKG